MAEDPRAQAAGNHGVAAGLDPALSDRVRTGALRVDWLTAIGTNHYSHYIDVDSFVDNHWIVEFTKQIDGYRLSNFFSKDRDAKLKMEPIWDWNLSFGNADYLDGESTSGWYHALTTPDDHLYLRRLITGTTSPSGTTGDPDFRAAPYRPLGRAARQCAVEFEPGGPRRCDRRLSWSSPGA